MANNVIPYLDLEASLDDWLAALDTKRFRLLHHFNLIRAACRKNHGWAPAPVQAMADMLGLRRPAAQTALRSLCDRKVLLRDPPFPQRPGSRPAMYLPNFWYPDWDVPLRPNLPKDLVLRSLGFSRAPEGWIVARSTGARLCGLDARPLTARQKRGQDPLTRAPISARLTEASSAPIGRASDDDDRWLKAARLIDGPVPGTQLHVVPEGTNSLEADEASKREPGFAELKYAVIDAAAPNPDGAAKDCWGAPERQLEELLVDHSKSKLLALLEYRPRDRQVPKLIIWMVEQAELGFPALPKAAVIEEAAKQHEVMANVYRNNGMEEAAAEREREAARLRDSIAATCDTGRLEVATA